MNIGFISPTPASDRRGTSGIPFYIAQELNRAFGQIVDLGPIEYPKAPLLNRIVWRAERTLSGKRYRWTTNQRCLTTRSGQLENVVRQTEVDSIFNCLEGWSLAHFDLSIPTWVCTDATFIQRLEMGWYKSSTNLPKRSIRQSIDAEKRIFQSAALVCVSSEWAADSVISDYEVPSEQVCVVPFGANIDPDEIPERDSIGFADGTDQTYRFLFLGVDWHRKGGDIAAETVAALNRMGVASELLVVGCEPQCGDFPWLKRLGFIDKNVPEQRKKLSALLEASHFLLLPTRSEAFGCVFAEAAAFGLPSIASAVGAVPEIIEDGVSGLVFDSADQGTTYAERIAEVISDLDAYHAMRRSARTLYENRLNWRVWGDLFSTYASRRI